MVFKITSIILALTVVTSCTGRLYFRPLPIRKDELEAPTPGPSNFVKFDQHDSMGLQKQALLGNGIDYTMSGGVGPPNQNEPDPNNYFALSNLGPGKTNIQGWSVNEEGNSHNQDGQGLPSNGDIDHMLDGSRPNSELIVKVPSQDNFRSNKYGGYRYNLDGFGSNNPIKRGEGFLNGRHAHIHSNGPNKSGVTMGVNHPEEQQEHHLPELRDQNQGEPEDNNQGNRGVDGYGPGGNEQPWIGHEEGNGNTDRGDSHGADFNGMNGYQPNSQQSGPNVPKQDCRHNPNTFGIGMNLGNHGTGEFGQGPIKPVAPNGMNPPEEQIQGAFKPVNHDMGGFPPNGQPQMSNQGAHVGNYDFGQNSGHNNPGRPSPGSFGGHNIILGGYSQTPGRFHKEGFGESGQIQSGHYF